MHVGPAQPVTPRTHATRYIHQSGRHARARAADSRPVNFHGILVLPKFQYASRRPEHDEVARCP